MLQFTCNGCERSITVHSGRAHKRNGKSYCTTCFYSPVPPTTPAPAAPPPSAPRTAPSFAALDAHERRTYRARRVYVAA